MRVVKVGTKGVPHDDVSVCRCIDDFGISLFHRPGRSYRPKTSSLNQVRDGSIPSGEQAVEQSVFDRIGFVAVEPNPDCPRRDPWHGGVRGPLRSRAIQLGKDSGMTLKSKRNETLELHASPIQPHAEDTSANHAPSHEEIRRRAYEIYLERNGFPGNELDDWHRAERELQKVALFKQGWNRLQQRGRPNSEDGN